MRAKKRARPTNCPTRLITSLMYECRINTHIGQHCSRDSTSRKPVLPFQVGHRPLECSASLPSWPLRDPAILRRRHPQVSAAGGECPHALGQLVPTAQDNECYGAAADRRLHLRDGTLPRSGRVVSHPFFTRGFLLANSLNATARA